MRRDKAEIEHEGKVFSPCMTWVFHLLHLKTDCIKNPFGKNTEGSKNRSGKQKLCYILFRTTTSLEKTGIKTQHPLDWVT